MSCPKSIVVKSFAGAGLGQRLLFLLQQAQQCHRLARNAGDQDAAGRLHRIAAQYEAEADVLTSRADISHRPRSEPAAKSSIQ